MGMRIALAKSAAEIEACFPVMKELRPQYDVQSFVEQRPRHQQEGYRLAYLEDEGSVVAVAGFRISLSLAWGRFLYVDDLVTQPGGRSKGYGRSLLKWLADHARENSCGELHLDSGVQRYGAHRFYLAHRMDITCHHFALKL